MEAIEPEISFPASDFTVMYIDLTSPNTIKYLLSLKYNFVYPKNIYSIGNSYFTLAKKLQQIYFKRLHLISSYYQKILYGVKFALLCL